MPRSSAGASGTADPAEPGRGPAPRSRADAARPDGAAPPDGAARSDGAALPEGTALPDGAAPPDGAALSEATGLPETTALPGGDGSSAPTAGRLPAPGAAAADHEARNDDPAATQAHSPAVAADHGLRDAPGTQLQSSPADGSPAAAAPAHPSDGAAGESSGHSGENSPSASAGAGEPDLSSKAAVRGSPGHERENAHTGSAAETSTTLPSRDDETPGRPRKSLRRNAVLAAAAVLLAAGTGGYLLLRGPERPIPGDASVLLDETVPDGTPIPAGTSFVKTWRIKNVGQVDWTGRYLEQSGTEGDSRCTAPRRVWIPDAPRGTTIRVAVPVDAGEQPGRCKIAWKMVDADGELFFPAEALRPVFFEVRVTG